MTTTQALQLDWSALHTAARGNRFCGDLCLVEPLGEGWLVAVADGAGRSAPAAQAAETCLGAVSGAGGDLAMLFARAHAAAREGRGAALAIAILDPTAGKLHWAAVGDITGWLGRAGARRSQGSGRLMKQAGVVGHRMPRLIARCFDLRPGDRLVIHTDGLGPFAEAALGLPLPPSSLAPRLLATAARGPDDALAFVAELREAA
jgi:negative regulator of sigma-B (phosphoserine phosphatase)